MEGIKTKGVIKCPCCSKGKILAYEDAAGKSSIHCSKCYTYLDSLRFSIISSPVCTILYLILSLAVAILPTYQVIINARFIDNALGLIDGSVTKRAVYISLAIVIGIIAYQWLVEPIRAYLANKIEMDMRVSLKGAYVEKCSKIEFKYVENTDSMDLMNRVADTMERKFIDGFTNIVNLISLFMTIAGLLIVLITQIAWVALIIIAVAIPLLYLSFISGKATYEANKEITKYQRKYKYLTTVMTGRENVDERTVFGYNEKLNDKWFEQYEISRKMETRTRAKWFVKLKSGSMITAFLCTFIAAMLINPVATGIITIGMFFSLINATFDLVHTMSWSLTRLIEAVSTHIEYLKEITKFAAFEQYDNADAVPEGGIEFKSLEFRNVTFKYPGTETYILKDMNMKIEAGRHYAFVGANGAGKSTIAKLLTGLYQDYEGRILINGRDLREYTAAQLKAFYSVVYQDFARYSISIWDNIAIGCVGGADDEAINNAITALKLDSVIEDLEDGKDTLLGKLAQEGKDLSGGEWQRIALARCFVSEAPIRVLDEPTAALDPIAESNLYSEFAKLCEGRTTLFFSHRLGSVKLADYIYVIDNGHVEEQGTHNELMAAKQLYYTMYDSQRRWYQ